jgi:transketolase
VQPGITVFVPADAGQVARAVAATAAVAGPLYLRLSRDDSSNHALGLAGRFDPASIELVRDGTDGLVLALGSSAGDALAAADLVTADGIRVAVGVVSCPHPSPSAELDALLSRFPFVVTVEAHYAAGGLGSLVAEHVAENGLRCRVARCAVRTMPTGTSGTREYLLERYGLSPSAIADAVRRVRGAVTPERAP